MSEAIPFPTERQEPKQAPKSKPLYEEERPSDWSQVVGQDKVLRQLEVIRRRSGLAGHAYWITGKTGTGKTTIARLIAAEVTGKASGEWAVTEFTDPSELNAEALAAIRLDIERRPFGSGVCYILNEAHGCTDGLVRKLLGLTETIPSWITWVFTTTVEGQKALFVDCLDASPLLSRCIKLQLSRRDLAEPFARRLKEAAMRHGLDGRDLADYVKLIYDEGLNLRAGYQAVESGAMLA